MRKKIWILIVMALSLCGCAKVAHIRQLLTLDGLSKNQARQEKYVEQVDESFEKMLEVVQNGRTAEYPDQKSILKNFGKPIYVKDVLKGGKMFEQWLYRYAVLYDKEKIYVDFNKDGKAVNWQLVPAKESEGQDE